MRITIFILFIFFLSVNVLPQDRTKLDTANSEAEKVNAVLKTFLSLGTDSVPFEVFKKAKGIAVFENVSQLNLLMSKGGKGKGLVTIRNGDGWSIPTFVNFAHFGYELKIADKKNFDIICFIMTQYLIEKLKTGSIKPDELNNHKLALGPVVKGAGADVVIERSSLIYYTFQYGKLSGIEFQNDGFFTGITITHDNKLNQAIYQKKGQTILSQNPNNLTPLNTVNLFQQTIIDSLKPKE
ncbi:MAG: lipid-binding SYLF domain-containing protein [Pyrinomonadaceae bacterium]|nr:lipid-binding SYLF domain-containing protein [Pyrinomonadaceae bacterium]